MSEIPVAIDAPHCDSRVLHRPGTCRFCDRYPQWQALRRLWGIAFTGEVADVAEQPCPADQSRGFAEAHRWPGNRPQPYIEGPWELDRATELEPGAGFPGDALREGLDRSISRAWIPRKPWYVRLRDWIEDRILGPEA